MTWDTSFFLMFFLNKRIYYISAVFCQGEPLVCTVLVFRVLLDSVHHNDLHVPGDLQGGKPTGEADPLQAG